MEDFNVIYIPTSEKRETGFHSLPSLTVSEDGSSSLEKGQGRQSHILASPSRGSNEENHAEDPLVVTKEGLGGQVIPYEWDTLLDPFARTTTNSMKSPSKTSGKHKEQETNPLQEKQSTPVNRARSPTRRRKPTPRSQKDPRQSQSSTRSVLSKATRDLIFNESTDSSDFETTNSCARVDSIEEVVPSNGSALQISRGSTSSSFDDHEHRWPMKTFQVKKANAEKRRNRMDALSKEKRQSTSRNSPGEKRISPKNQEQEKAPQVVLEEKNMLIPQHPFTIANLFANGCLSSQHTPDHKDEATNILMARPTNHLAVLAGLFQCGSQQRDDATSPRNSQLVLDAFDRTLCGIPAKMANISLDDFLYDDLESFDEDTEWQRPPAVRSRPRKESPSLSSTSKTDASSDLYGVLKEHIMKGGENLGKQKTSALGESIDNDPEIQRELQRLCKLLEAKLDGQHLEQSDDDSDVEEYSDDESDSDYDDEEERQFEDWMRTGPITDLFGISCNEKQRAWHELTYHDLRAFESHNNHYGFNPRNDDNSSDESEDDYYSDAESTESNLTVVTARNYK